MSDLISRQAAIDALWKALYEYEDRTEKQFQESEELDVGDWIVHRGFVQNMSDIDRQTILNLPSADMQEDLDNAYQHGWTAAEAEYQEAMRDAIPLWYIEEWMKSPIGGNTFEDLKSCWLNDIENHHDEMKKRMDGEQDETD